MRKITNVVLIGLSVVTLLLGGQAGSASAATVGEQEQIISLVNAERSARGLGPVYYEQRLTNAAEGYANYMASANFFGHTGLDGTNFVARNEAEGYQGWRFLGENLAAGQTAPERVVQMWMNSPGHRANVLAERACEIGIGHSYSANSQYENYWAMETGC